MTPSERTADEWFEEFFSDALGDDEAIRRFLASVPDTLWPEFQRAAAAHIAARLHGPGLAAAPAGTMNDGTLRIVTPLMDRMRQPYRRRLHLLAEEDRRRQRRRRRRGGP
ncbi:MAG: hypothetical protein K6T35_01860 [Meiothermus silvanus]|nr:hypothetical protein [Allomeiothermus silvanus]